MGSHQDTSSCPQDEAKPLVLPPLVFVHGLKGSHLKKPGSLVRRYLSVPRLLGGRFLAGVDEMPLPRSYVNGTGEQESDGLVPDGPIEDVRLLGLKVSEMYSPILQWFSSTGRRLYKFDYDWRRSPLEAGHKLEAFLEKVLLKEREANLWHGGVQVVCHSNGGVVTYPVIVRKPQLFQSVLWAASGTLGGVGFLADLSVKGHEGNLMSGNDSMMTPDLWLGWTSGFHLLPSVEEQDERVRRFGLESFAEVEGGGNTIRPKDVVDLHELQTWKALQLGPFHPRSGVALPLSVADEAFFSETLKRARSYRRLMTFEPSVTYPPMAVLASESEATPSTWVRSSTAAPFSFGNGPADVRTERGDGRFTFASAGPPVGVPVVLSLRSEKSHTGVATDLPKIAEALDVLLEARQGCMAGESDGF